MIAIQLEFRTVKLEIYPCSNFKFSYNIGDKVIPIIYGSTGKVVITTVCLCNFVDFLC